MYQYQADYCEKWGENKTRCAALTVTPSPPFKFAVCISSSIPISRDPSCHEEILRGISASVVEQKLNSQQMVFVKCLARSFESAKKVGVIEPSFDVDFFRVRETRTRTRDAGGNDKGDGHHVRDDFSPDLIPRVMHADLLPQRLRIPTVHVTGKQDLPIMNEMADLARGICDQKLMRVLQHSGGHSIPRKVSEVRQLVLAMEWAIDQAQKLW